MMTPRRARVLGGVGLILLMAAGAATHARMQADGSFPDGRLHFVNVGFVSSGPEAQREGVRFSTTDRGNSNRGHLYGTLLDTASKEALLEYLKTK